MNLTLQEKIKWLNKKYNFRPSRKFGQNFLISEYVLSSMIKVSKLADSDTVLEIGAGFGTLTIELSKRVGRVIAVESDKRLIEALKKLAGVNKNISVIGGDIFKEWPVIGRRLTDLQYKLIASLPYNITSLVLRNFLECKPRPKEMVVLVQKEVAERVTARPGSMSILSVAVQFYAIPEIIEIVPKDCFWPVPNVDSAILKIRLSSGNDLINKYQRLLGSISSKNFFSLVKIGFSAKRKQLHNNLSAGLPLDGKKVRNMLDKIGIDPLIRPQNLSINEWIKITKYLNK